MPNAPHAHPGAQYLPLPSRPLGAVARARRRLWGPRALTLTVAMAWMTVLAACPTTRPRNPKASATQYKLGHDYFDRALKEQNPEARSRFINVALVELRKSIRADDQNHHAHFLISLLYLYKGQKSLEEMTVLQCLQGKESEEYRAETEALMRNSMTHMQKAFSLRNEKDSRIALNLSTIHLHFKDYVSTERYARKALSDIAYSTPHFARANIGRAQFAQGRYLKALKNLKQAVFSEPRFCPGHYWLGRVEFATNKFDSALQRFEAALTCCRKERIAPIQDAMLYRGLALARLGRADEAKVALQDCVKQAPKSCVASRCSRSLTTMQGSPR